jgi:carbonic anhydrase/acetyltransferase-like protein (isoleucine patch superfamily)
MTMLIEHNGKRPRIHPSAYVAPTAVISGEVEIGQNSRVLHGAVITAEGSPVTIGQECVVMEHAVIRGAGGRSRHFPAVVGDRTLIGPHAYLVGCTVDEDCFIATGAMVFNDAHVKSGCTVTLGGIVHIGTILAPETTVPLQHVAIGTQARIFAPSETEEMMEALAKENFRRRVFGVETEGRSRAEIIGESTRRYARALTSHGADRVIQGNE